MTTLRVRPARCRDYQSREALVLDLEANRDFLVDDMASPWDGKPCSLADMRRAGVTRVYARYKNLRMATVVVISQQSLA